VVVSSPQAARRLLALVGRIDVPVAAVGEGTAALLPGDVIVPRRGVGADALVEELKDRVRGKRVLVPRAERGNPELIEGLIRAGAQVEALTLYRTVTPKSADPAVLRELRGGGIDAIIFASGSAVRGFVALAGAESASRSAVVCLGGSAAGETGAAGIRVDAAGFDGLPELCDALADVLFKRRRGT
jgi:uroporphyrinogen III methyltransferase/synthase